MNYSATTIPRILVIDDEPVIIRMLHECLKASYQVTWSTDGFKGLALAEETRPDLILLDVIMPGMDGYEFCRRLRNSSKTCGIPVIFLTSQASADDVVHGYEAGGTDYLAKPFETSELLARVNTQIQLQQIKRDLERRNLDLAEANQRLEEALATNNILLQEMNHRVKNNLNIACNLLRVQGNMIPDPHYRELFTEAEYRIRTMAHLHELIYTSASGDNVHSQDYFSGITATLLKAFGQEPISIKVACHGVRLHMSEAIPCGLILNELITNALKYAFPDNRPGTIIVSLAEEEAERVFMVKDNGVGLPEHLPSGQSDSLGLFLVTNLVEQLGGTLEIERIGGTAFKFRFRSPGCGLSSGAATTMIVE